MHKIILFLSCLICLAAAGRLGIERRHWWFQNVGQQQKEQNKMAFEYITGSSKQIQEKQLFLLDILLQVHKPLVNRKLIELGQVLIMDPAMYIEPTDELLLQFLEKCRQHEILGREQNYSDLNIEHSYQFVGLTKFLTLAKDFSTFQHNVCFARLHVNPIIFVNALMRALQERKDTNDLVVPAMNEILPQLFYDQDVVMTAENVDWHDLLIGSQKVSTKPSLVNMLHLNGVMHMITPINWIRINNSGRMSKEAQIVANTNDLRNMVNDPSNFEVKSETKFVIPVEHKSSISYLTDDVGLNIFWNEVMNERLIQTFTGGKHSNNNRNRYWNANIQENEESIERRDDWTLQNVRGSDNVLSRRGRGNDYKNWISIDRNAHRHEKQTEQSVERLQGQMSVENLPSFNVANERLLHVGRRRQNKAQKERQHDWFSSENNEESTQVNRQRFQTQRDTVERDQDQIRVGLGRGEQIVQSSGRNVYESDNLVNRQRFDTQGQDTPYQARESREDIRRYNFPVYEDNTGKLNFVKSQRYIDTLQKDLGLNHVQYTPNQSRQWGRKPLQQSSLGNIFDNDRSESNENFEHPQYQYAVNQGRQLHKEALDQSSFGTNFDSDHSVNNEFFEQPIQRIGQRTKAQRDVYSLEREQDQDEQRRIIAVDRLMTRRRMDDERENNKRIPRSIKNLNISPTEDLMDARSGEIFIQNLRQLMARFNLEKLSLGLKETENVQDSISSPKLLTTNNVQYQQRVISPEVARQKIQQSIQQLQSIIDRELNNARVQLNSPEVLRIIGDILVENNGQQTNIWDELYNQITRSVYGQSAYIEQQQQQAATALSIPSGNLREPIYLDIVEGINKLIDSYVQNLQPYTRSQLNAPGVVIKSIDVDRLMTYFDVTDADLINLVDQQLLLSNTNNIQRLQKQLVARQTRLNHKQFTLGYEILSDDNQRVVVRTFIGPKIVNSRQMEEKRNSFMLLDAFVKNLEPGLNRVERNSRDITWTSRDVTTLSEIYRTVMRDMSTKNLVSTNCRFPHRLLIPRGTYDGVPMQLFVIVTPVTEEDRRVQHLVNPNNICGLGVAGISLDTLPLNFPLDRKIENSKEFLQGNMMLKDVLVMHDERVQVDTV